MFKFNFNIEADDEEDEVKLSKNNQDEETTSNVPYGVIDFNELDSLSSNSERLDSKFFKKIMLDEVNFVEYIYIENSNLINLIKNNDDLIEITKTHDLVNGKYEGGFKVWECSVDLSQYLYSNYKTDLSELNIFEIGCGHALPSLSLLKKLISIKHLKVVNLYLQDYNRDCIELITYLNVKKFLVDNSELLKASLVELNIKFVYGDWKALSASNLLPMNSFDILLTSETIYNRLYYKGLLELCKNLLNLKDSYILLAAKTCYFGCSGSLNEFLTLSKSSSYNFKNSQNLLVSSELSVIHGTISREIIKLFM
jgi:hypothetical protein